MMIIIMLMLLMIIMVMVMMVMMPRKKKWFTSPSNNYAKGKELVPSKIHFYHSPKQ